MSIGRSWHAILALNPARAWNTLSVCPFESSNRSMVLLAFASRKWRIGRDLAENPCDSIFWVNFKGVSG